MARSTATADVKATRHGKRLRQREGALSERHFLKGQLSRTSNACSKGGRSFASDTRELDLKELCANADGHQLASAPATTLTQMRGNSHLLVLKELRQQRQVCKHPTRSWI